MACQSFSRRLTLTAAIFIAAANAQTPVSIPDATVRRASDFLPQLAGRHLTVRGIVACKPVLMLEYTQLVIQDDSGAGLTIRGTLPSLKDLKAGFEVEVTGVLESRAGLPVLRPQRILPLGTEPAPESQRLSISALNDVRNVGRYVSVEGLVQWVGQNAGGELLALGSGEEVIQVFYPYSGRRRENVLQRYRKGDGVIVTGMSSQYAPLPPYNRSFEIIIAEPSAILLISPSSLISPPLFLLAVVTGIGILSVWWWRERKLASQQRILRELMKIAEDVIASFSPNDAARRLSAIQADMLGPVSTEIYLHSEPTQSLDRVTTEQSRNVLSISLARPVGALQFLNVLCFRNRTMLVVRDLRRSTLLAEHLADNQEQLPASAVITPMLAQGQLLGIISMTYSRRTSMNGDFQHALQHVANQVAASLKLQEQQLMKEQLMRSEKMAAAGQLISGVAADLSLPLNNIARLSEVMIDKTAERFSVEFREIASEAQRGLDLVDHLLSFSNMEKREPRPVDVHALLSKLIDLRETEQKRRGITTDSHIPVSPVNVWADQAQIDQALLIVLVHAERAASESRDRCVEVSSRILGRRVQIVFESQASPESAGTTDQTELGDYFGFPVAQAILQSHGGDLRDVSSERGSFRLEVELPLLAQSAVAAGEISTRREGTGRVLTSLIVDPDVLSQRRLVSLLAARGHRAIPIASAEEAAEMVQRAQFDVMFCATRISGLSWVELFQRVRRRVGVFALLKDGYDSDTIRTFGNGEGQVLSKAVDERELDHVLGVVEVRWAASKR